MKVLFPVSEAYPLYKIGGLGDVGGSLPIALSKLDIDVRVALPLHPEISLSQRTVTDTFNIIYNKQKLTVEVLLTNLGNSDVPVYLFNENRYLSQHTDASDNHADKFSVFCLAIAEWLNLPDPTFEPHLIHLHDWHTALIPMLLKARGIQDKYKTVINIHNLAYQGMTDTPVFARLGLDSQNSGSLNWKPEEGKTNLLLEGLLQSDKIVAVSPTYSKEILTDEYGEGINEQLSAREDAIVGIINGIDLEVFNSTKDPYIYKNFSLEDYTEGKAVNKKGLCEELGFDPNPDIPMIGFVGRVDPGQKGIQVIIQAIKSGQFPPEKTQFVFLGTGDPKLEAGLHQACEDLNNVAIFTRYDEPLAARIYAASDLMIIPSKYEPCGLVQMIAMRYAALPIARKTGGLADTILHHEDGFLFDDYTPESLIEATQSALDYINDSENLTSLRRKALSKDFSWDKPALEYKNLFEELILRS